MLAYVEIDGVYGDLGNVYAYDPGADIETELIDELLYASFN